MTKQQATTFLRWVSLAGVYGGLLMPLMFIPIVIFPFVFSKLIFLQILIGLTFPAYLTLAWMEPAYRPKMHLLYGAIVAYFVAMALSVLFAVDPARAWWGNQERMNGLFTLLHFLAWLTMAVGMLKTWDQWKKILNFEVALSMFMAIVAMLQKVDRNILLFPAAADRVGGLLDNPIYMGAYQIFNLFFLGLLFLKTPSTKMRIWYGVIALFDIGAFFFAESRGDLLGLGAGIFAFAVFYGLFNKNKKARNTTLGLIAIAFIAYGLLFAFRDTHLVKYSVFGRLTDFHTTLDTRLIAWKIAWQGFLERPLTGWGLDNFHILFNQKYNPQSERFGSYETWFDRSHNQVLDVLSMTGVLGFITYFGIFGTLLFSVWRAYRKGRLDLPTSAILFSLPIGYFVQNLFVFDHPAAFSMSYLLFAFVIASTSPSFLGQDPAALSEKNGRRFSWALFGVLELLGLLVAWRFSVLPFRASQLSIQANNLFTSQPTVSLALAKQAADIPTPYHDEQVFLVSRNIMTLAEQGVITRLSNWKDYYALDKQLIASEMALHPRSTHDLLIDARLAHDMASYVPGEAAEAERIYRIAIQTSPKRQQLYYSLARLYVQANRVDDALAIYKQVAEFDPELGEGYWQYGVSLMYDKNDVINGAKQIVKSQTVTYKYHFQDVRELGPLADAYVALNDKEGLKKIPDLLLDIPVSTATNYAQLAFKLNSAHMTDERDKVLAFGERVAPGTSAAYDQIIQNSTTLSVPAKK